MRILVLYLLALIVALPQTFAENDLLSREEFTQRFLLEAQDRHPDIDFDQVDEGSISYGQDEDADDRGMMFTDYAYDLYLEDPDQLIDVIDQWISALPLGEEIDLSDVANRVVVVIRPPSYLTSVHEDLRKETIHRPFVGDMVAIMMLDSPEALSTVSFKLLEENNLTVDEAFILAESNSRRLIGEVYSEDYNGIEVLGSSNGLITSLPWLPETCREGVPPFAMMIIDREYVMRVDTTGESEAFRIFMQAATEMILANESLGTGVFFCSDGAWVFATPTDPSEGP